MDQTPEAKRADLNASTSSIQSFLSKRRRSTLTMKTVRDNIKVAVRCRPLLPSDKGGLQTRVKMSVKDNWVEVQGEYKKKKKTKYTFDFVYPHHTTQEHLFQTSIAPIIDDVIQGFNCTVFAYGQTGTGKTFTMEGSKDHTGVIARSVHLLFSKLSTELAYLESTITVSHLEIYNEELCDLLNEHDAQKLSIYRDKRVRVKNLTEIVVSSADEIFRILHQSLQKRRKGASTLNKESSRSHCIFTISILMKEPGISSKDLYKIGTLNLVDLAGSECVGKGASTSERCRETKNINRSLLTLGMVISSLVERKSHIPFRDSKLTRLLRESLGGRNKTLLIATISPSSSPDVLLNTLHYAHKAKKIENKPEINAKMTEKQVVRNLMLQIERLKNDLHAQRRKDGIFMNQDNYDTQLQVLESQRANIKDLETERDLLLDQYHSQGTALSQARNELDLTKRELCQCRETLKREIFQRQEELKLVLTKAKTLENNEKELRALLQKTISERDALLKKTVRFESLQEKNNDSIREKTDLVKKLHAELHDETKNDFSIESKRIMGIANRIENSTANAMLASKARESTAEKRRQGMGELFNEIATLEETSEKQQTDFIASMTHLSSTHQQNLREFKQKISKDMENKMMKLKIMKQLAENFTKETDALSDLISQENQLLTSQYSHLTNQFKIQMQDECTKTQTASNERFLNIRMKSTEFKNQAEAHQKSEMEFLTTARESLEEIQDATIKLKLADDNFERLKKDHKHRLDKADEVVSASKLQQYRRTQETPLKQDFVNPKEFPPLISPIPMRTFLQNRDSHLNAAKRHRDETHFRKPRKRKKYEVIQIE